MMRNKNVKTEGNSTLLKMQYGHHRMIRSATQRRESEDLEGRRLKSAMLVKHPESNLSDAGDAKLTRKESLSNFYASNPHLSKATRSPSFNSDKKRLLGENSDKKRLLSESYLYQKSHDSHKSIEDIVGNAFDPEEDFDYDAEDDLSSSQKPEWTPEPVDDEYGRICKNMGALPSGKFKRQISCPVADMSYSLLGTKDIKSISVALTHNINIKDLDLSGNDLSGKGASYLAQGLKENISVDDLNISECNISYDGLESICSLLMEMKPMKRLSMARNKFDKKHAKIIGEVIKKNDYIEDLDLAGNEFSEEGGVLIGKALGSNVGIRRLNLSWNHIRREGAIVVCNALRFNQTIEELDLSWNGLAEEGCRALQKSLPPNHTLKELDLTCNRINVFSLRYLLDGLEINDTLQTLFIDKNPITTDGAILLMKVLDKSDMSAMTDVHLAKIRKEVREYVVCCSSDWRFKRQQDIPINPDFMDALEDLQKKKDIKVHHRDPNRKKITQIVMERTLNDFDPALILFEYMKQQNLRLIDLFRVFDTDDSHTVSKTELKEGFISINLPIAENNLNSLFDRMDLNDNHEIEYDEYKVGYRKTMNRIRRDELDEDDKNLDTISELRKLIQKALRESRDAQIGAKHRVQRQASMRRASLTAVFKLGMKDK